MEQNRAYLRQEFRDGERPSGKDFEDFIDSYLNKKDDGVAVENVNKNLNIPAGISIGDTVAGKAGTLRFNAGKVQVSDGVAWTDVGGAAGGANFAPVGATTAISYGAGNVGIGPFAVAPLYKLEVPLGPNVIGSEAERVRFGNAAISNGIGAFQTSTQLAHVSMGNDNNSFALRQNPAGETRMNSPLAQAVLVTQGGTNVRIMVIPTTGQVIINNNGQVAGAAGEALQVNGNGFKTVGGGTWAAPSDGRFKKDVANFDDGLEKLLQVRTVRFRYDGLPGVETTDNEEIGIIGQEMQQIFPYMISANPVREDLKKSMGTDEILMYNSNALTYVMVNAIQELAQQVKDLEDKLEQQKKAAQA
jgi:hypothetical protein